MKLTIEIAMDNAAFQEGEHSWEVARILRDLAKRIEGHPHFWPGHSAAILDVNGNEIGHCTVRD